MADARHPGDEHANVRYEPSDAHFGGIFSILVGSAIFLIIVMYVVFSFFSGYRAYQESIKPSNYPLARGNAETLPPDPRLEQVNRMAGIDKGNVFLLDVKAERIRDSYGDTEEKGYIHIPIDRAMDYLTNKLPVRKQQPSPEQERRQNGLVDAGASNSGRMFRGPHP